MRPDEQQGEPRAESVQMWRWVGEADIAEFGGEWQMNGLPPEPDPAWEIKTFYPGDLLEALEAERDRLRGDAAAYNDGEGFSSVAHQLEAAADRLDHIIQTYKEDR